MKRHLRQLWATLFSLSLTTGLLGNEAALAMQGSTEEASGPTNTSHAPAMLPEIDPVEELIIEGRPVSEFLPSLDLERSLSDLTPLKSTALKAEVARLVQAHMAPCDMPETLAPSIITCLVQEVRSRQMIHALEERLQQAREQYGIEFATLYLTQIMEKKIEEKHPAFHAARKGLLKVLKYLVRQMGGVDFLSKGGGFKFSNLYASIAATRGHIPILTYLVRVLPDGVEILDKRSLKDLSLGETAIAAGHIPMIHYIAHTAIGGPPHVLESWGKNRLTPAHIAVLGDQLPADQFFPTKPNKDPTGARHLAMFKYIIETAPSKERILEVRGGAEQDAPQGLTPVQYAALHNRWEILSYCATLPNNDILFEDVFALALSPEAGRIINSILLKREQETARNASSILCSQAPSPKVQPPLLDPISIAAEAFFIVAEHTGFLSTRVNGVYRPPESEQSF